MNRRPRLEIVAPAASPEEAAAVLAALERFMREHSPPPIVTSPRLDRWARTALLEGTGNEAQGSWGESHRWGA